MPPASDTTAVRVVNATRGGAVVAERCEVARTFWTRGMGLMGRQELAHGTGLLIYPEWSIHTFFMRFAIDVLFVSADDRVVGLREAMPPGRPYAGVWGARYVVELPAGCIAETGPCKDDVLHVTPSPHAP